MIMRSIHFLVNKIFLKVENGISHLVVVSDIVWVNDIHSFGIFDKRPGVLRPRCFFLLVAEGAAPADKSNEGVVEEKLYEGYHRYYDVEGKIKFFVEFIENSC